jgi:hypothetical protein
MRDEYLKVKDRETSLLDELEKQKKKLVFYENKYNSYSNKLSKGEILYFYFKRTD